MAKMGKQTYILIFALFFFTAGLLALALNKSSHGPKVTPVKPVSPTPTTNPNLPDTSLLFGKLQIIIASESAVVSPSAVQTSQAETKAYTLPIFIDTGANHVSAVQLELAFDPNILTDVSINPSGFFENPVILFQQIDSANGRISYALSASPSASKSANFEGGSKQGNATLAILTFQMNKQLRTNTTITFLPKTFVLAEGLEISALKSTNSAELKFAN